MGYGTGPVNRGHSHRYGGVTTFNFGHIHRYGGTSSVNYGGVDAHTHTLSGTTTLDSGHVHNYFVVTGPGIYAGPGRHVHRYYGVTTANGRGPHVHRYSGITAPAENDRLTAAHRAVFYFQIARIIFPSRQSVA